VATDLEIPPEGDNVFTGLFQPTHLIILLVVALVVLGPKKLPEAGRALGQGLREFKHSVSDGGADARELPAASAPAEREVPST
jgi:sec-independent protein translocase protein TatA